MSDAADRLHEELARKLESLIGDIAKLKAELERAEELAELCFLEGELQDIRAAMNEAQSDPRSPDQEDPD
ncbi:hypothetical protein [Candidatus Nitrospira bockiana]